MQAFRHGTVVPAVASAPAARGVQRHPPCEAVALAASLGGLAAFRAVLGPLPADFPAPILLVQHLHPAYPSLLPEILAAHTALAVAPAREGDVLRPGHVYVAQPGRHLLVRPDRTLALSSEAPDCGARPSADHLFTSLAAVFGDRAVAVLLTGRGRDGAAGLAAVRRRGGTTIAQSPATCRAADMPLAAIEAGVEMVLPLEKIGPMLQILAAGAAAGPAAAAV